MILTLRLRNAAVSPGSVPAELVLDRRGAVLGRSPACDWILADPRSYVSSRHCEIRWDGAGYVLSDTSTNGTFLNGSRERLSAPRRIVNGDVFVVGPFEIVAALSAGDVGEAQGPDRSGPAARPVPVDPWARVADGDADDWAHGASAPPAMRTAIAGTAIPSPAPGEIGRHGQSEWGALLAAQIAAASPLPSAPAATDPALARFAAAAGVQPALLRSPDGETLARAGRLFGRLVAGLAAMVEARARAKSQLGAESTSLRFDGNNPLKFARAPEQAAAQLLNPTERGFMDAERAIEDAFQDIEAHQIATLKAMQGALRATLDRFSPAAIRKRAESKGLLARILPGAREAALWQAYEREFGGVAQGSDEAFMDMFAKEFRRAYEEQTRR